jgi:hypothetical protein
VVCAFRILFHTVRIVRRKTLRSFPALTVSKCGNERQVPESCQVFHTL